MLKPLYDCVVLELEEVKKQTASGIILNETNNNKPDIACVVAVGEGNYENGELRPLRVKVKDKVVFKRYSATEVEHENKKYLIVRENDILAIVE